MRPAPGAAPRRGSGPAARGPFPAGPAVRPGPQGSRSRPPRPQGRRGSAPKRSVLRPAARGRRGAFQLWRSRGRRRPGRQKASFRGCPARRRPRGWILPARAFRPERPARRNPRRGGPLRPRRRPDRAAERPAGPARRSARGGASRPVRPGPASAGACPALPRPQSGRRWRRSAPAPARPAGRPEGEAPLPATPARPPRRGGPARPERLRRRPLRPSSGRRAAARCGRSALPAGG